MPEASTESAPARTRYVFDSSAFIAYFRNEEGGTQVERLLEQALADEIEVYVASVDVYEVYYDSVRRETPEEAEDVFSDIGRLPITVIEKIDAELMRHAASFKAKHRMSLADSIALGLAR